jgi:VWFA-related protein
MSRQAKRFLGVAAAVLALTAGGLAAQQPTQSSQQPVFRARTDLVSVFVVAVDANNDPVHGLTKENFTLTDRKKTQEISVFDEVSHEETPSTPEFVLPATLKRDVVSNRADLGDRLVVVLIDDLHMYKNRADRAKSIVRDLVDRLGQRTLIGLLFTSGKHSLAAVTQDQSLVLAAVDTLKGQRAVPRPLDAIDSQTPHIMPDPGDIEARRAVLATANSASLQDFYDNMSFYKTLQDAARMLLADDGRRKTFVLVSEGIGKDLSWLPTLVSPCEARDTLNKDDPNSTITPCYHDRAILAIMQSLRRSNVATYAIDPRGEVQSKDLMKECMPSPPGGGTDDPCFMGLTDWGSQVRQAQQGLEITATLTGGFAVTNTNDFAGGINHIVSDLDNYYLLGFYPADRSGSGFRALDVTVDRPGVTLRFRQGYEVGAAPPPPKGASNPLTALAMGMTAKRDLPLRITATAFPGNARLARVATTIEISVPRHDLEDADGRVSDELKYSLLVADMKSGKVVKQLSNTATVSSKGGGDVAPSSFVSYQMPMTPDLPPGRYQLRASAISAKLSRSGSVYLDLEVPDFTKDPVMLSGLSVGYADGPHVTQAKPAGAIPIIPFDPSLDREFRTSDRVRVFLEVVRKGSAAGKLTIEFVDYTDRVLLTLTPGLASGNVVPVDVALPLSGFTPGAYRLRATATTGGTTATQEIGLIVR